MNCTEVRLLLHAYLDGELDAANSLELERHLNMCATCSSADKSLESLRTALRNSELNLRAPESLRQDLRQFLREMEDRRKSRWRVNPVWFWRALAFGATVFALLALLLRPSGISEHDAFLDSVVASHVRSLQVEHLTDVASSDQHTVKPWFDGKLDFAPNVKDFAEQGFPLVGGRLDYLAGRNVAALVYRRNKHLINVFIWPAANAKTFSTEHCRGFAVVSGDLNGMHYCLVSDLNAQELAVLAALMR